MQLFILDKIPQKAVKMLADCHIIKLCLETAQILSSVIKNQGKSSDPALPKPYNPNHPVIKAIDNQFKINYVLDYNKALHNEFIRRFNKKHAYFSLINIYEQILFNKTDIKSDFSFAQDFKNFSTEETNIFNAFKAYYKFKKSIIKRWKYTNAKEPSWLI
jgi:hypothetical protein